MERLLTRKGEWALARENLVGQQPRTQGGFNNGCKETKHQEEGHQEEGRPEEEGYAEEEVVFCGRMRSSCPGLWRSWERA